MTKKRQAPQKNPSQRGSIIIAAVGMVLIVVMIVAVVAASRGQAPGSDTPVPPQMMTLDATTLANLTRLPAATPLSGAEAQPYVALGLMVDACADFDDAHRTQMHQHLTWLLDPSGIPSDMIAIAFGSDPTGKLLFGMGSFAQNQWLIIDKKPGSCVIDVGKRLNQMLTAVGQPTFKVFEQ